MTGIFRKFSNKIDNCISEGSGWIIESIDPESVNIFNIHTLNCLIN